MFNLRLKCNMVLHIKKHVLLLLSLSACLKADKAGGQNRFFYLQAQLAPKLSVNSNTGRMGMEVPTKPMAVRH